ncbi:MAG: hypothetical protein ACKOAX_08515, partial [Candidatus Kapaibacterium sp.]
MRYDVMKKLRHADQRNVRIRRLLRRFLLVVFVSMPWAACDNLQLPQTYDKGPCGDTVDTTNT